MINKQSFAQAAKRIRRTGRGFHDPQLMHPNREWGTGLSVAALIFVVSAVWSAETYLRYRSASINVVEPVTENVQIYRAALIDAALENFSERQVANESFMKRVVVEDIIVEIGEEEELVLEEGGAENGEQATTTAEGIIEEEGVGTATTSEEVLELKND
jgi:hypothetical protein